MAGPLQLDDLYLEVILDHYKNPHGRTQVEDPTWTEPGRNPACGDELDISVRMADGKVEGLEVQARGCAISVASSSILALQLKGKTIEEARRYVRAFVAMMHGEDWPTDLEAGDIEVLTGVGKYPSRVKCALMAWTTMGAGLDKHHPED